MARFCSSQWIKSGGFWSRLFFLIEFKMFMMLGKRWPSFSTALQYIKKKQNHFSGRSFSLQLTVLIHHSCYSSMLRRIVSRLLKGIIMGKPFPRRKCSIHIVPQTIRSSTYCSYRTVQHYWLASHLFYTPQTYVWNS